jgi:hypothetical protein
MARAFLIRGMVCGIVAGLIVFVIARIWGEGPIDSAIAVEHQIAHATAEAHEHEGIVSRALQAGWGLFVGTMLYSIAIAGLFSLVFAFAWGRMGRLSARASSALLAAAAFVAVYLVPFLKYPANPPSVGSPETIGYRTALYFGMIVISIGAMVAAVNLGRGLAQRLGTWRASLAGATAYVAIVAIACLAMPAINEVPDAFPAALLWQFRIVALGMQVALWTSVGLLFGELTERSLASSGRAATLHRAA